MEGVIRSIGAVIFCLGSMAGLYFSIAWFVNTVGPWYTFAFLGGMFFQLAIIVLYEKVTGDRICD
jgi:hypothetical protein